jgi:hypothetical protein
MMPLDIQLPSEQNLNEFSQNFVFDDQSMMNSKHQYLQASSKAHDESYLDGTSIYE